METDSALTINTTHKFSSPRQGHNTHQSNMTKLMTKRHAHTYTLSTYSQNDFKMKNRGLENLKL